MKVPKKIVLKDEERAAIDRLEAALNGLPETLRITADQDDGIQVWRKDRGSFSYPLVADLDLNKEVLL